MTHLCKEIAWWRFKDRTPPPRHLLPAEDLGVTVSTGSPTRSPYLLEDVPRTTNYSERYALVMGLTYKIGMVLRHC
jgi:hypothetical protein